MNGSSETMIASLPLLIGSMCAFAPYDLENAETIGYDVVVNRPKATAYRAPGAPIAAYGVESTLDQLARKLKIDPIALREKNAAQQGTRTVYGPTLGVVGFKQTLAAAKNHPHYKAPLGPSQGRGMASGYWFNVGGETSCAVSILEDGTAVVTSGTPDIGGSRASLVIMAAEELGIDVNQIRAIIADTSSLGFNRHTGGSRVTFAAGMAAEAVRYLQMAGVINLLQNRLWDTSWLLSDSSLVGRALHVLIGYDDRPTALQVIVYAVTLAIILALIRMARSERQPRTAS